MDTFRWWSGPLNGTHAGFTEEDGGRNSAYEHLLTVSAPGYPLIPVNETVLVQQIDGIHVYFELYCD